MRILFVAMHRLDRSPSQRYRFEQYFSYFTQNGFTCELSSLISSRDDHILYSEGHYFGKTLILAKSLFKRLADVIHSKKYDLIFIQREALMIGSTLIERLLSNTRTPVIFDFDDSIWLYDENNANKSLAFLKYPAKTSKIIGLCDHVIAGNEYLATYAEQFNQEVSIIPTTIDTDLYTPLVHRHKGPICLGWTGSFSTVKHFELAIPVLKQLKEKYGDNIRFKLIGDADYTNKDLEITGQAWQASTEVEDLSDIDIGIMPLPDDDWSKGKCGLKGLQYMAMGIATVMSPVGVNTDIIDDGINGYLASSEQEWVEKLSLLIENEALRSTLGVKGRETVVQQYSVESNKHKYLTLFNEVINKNA